MRVTVIGSGLVGSDLGRALQRGGHHVVGTTTTPGRVAELADRFDQVRVLVGRDREAVAAAVDGADAVVVTAGPSAANAMSHADRAATYHDVLVATAQSVVAATAHAHLVMLSSLTVYGTAADHLGLVDEDSPVSASDDPSPAGFLAAEAVYRHGAGDRSCIFRCADITGPADLPIEDKVAMAHRVLGGSVPFGPDSLFYRVEVADVVDAVVFALDRRLVGTYNLTHHDLPGTNREIFDAIARGQGNGPLEYRDELQRADRSGVGGPVAPCGIRCGPLCGDVAARLTNSAAARLTNPSPRRLRTDRRMFGDDFAAVHMAWGAVNELTTLRFYGLVRQRTASPLLSRILRDVMAQEALHYAFYRLAATNRLEGNDHGQRLTRLALRRLWSPVGVGLRSRADADRLMQGLFEPVPDKATRIDAAIGTIPGLAGMDLISGCLRAA